MKTDHRAGDVALGVLGIILFLLLWQIIGTYRLAGLTWPPLTDVIDTLSDPNRTGLFLRGAKSTYSSAAIGFALGTALGLSVATGVHLAPPLRFGVDRLASVVNALPGIALGPILIVTLGPAAAPVALATISVFFLTYVAARAGFANAAQANQDLFTVLGARRVRRLWHLELPAALPTIASGVRLSVGAAMIGAVLGEWFGAPHGLGLIVIGAMQNFQIPLLWCAVLLIGAASIVAYAAATVLEAAAYRTFHG
jgi:ABC-type nitrate/sulfonate/bicarbonate transport system permease component